MEKRGIRFGMYDPDCVINGQVVNFTTYDTVAYGWTLTGWQLSAPVQKTKYLDKPGGDGSYDLSTALTDGYARYADRQLTVTLEHSGGDRLSREARIREMVNKLDGTRQNIMLPDDAEHYVMGRISVRREYNDMAHAAVTISAVCEPWRYSTTNSRYRITAGASEKTALITNTGKRPVVPLLTVTGTNASVRLTFRTASATFGPGVHKWPDFQMGPSTHSLAYSGSGTVEITFREAVLE